MVENLGVDTGIMFLSCRGAEIDGGWQPPPPPSSVRLLEKPSKARVKE
jgi:hypothetical protein